jgi:glycosyltransferase involved in cell wall biosynthesis
MIMTEAIFATSLILIAWSYFGYPLSLWLLHFVRCHPVRKKAIFPSITFIITACNEERRIREKLENTLTVNYPQEKLQILVVSDGSTDRTIAIVEEFAGAGIELLALPERRGKENAQAEALRLAEGEILVFSDVATRLEPGGLQAMVANFADATVGCVSSVDRVMNERGSPGGEGFYVRYEMWLRTLESAVHSLVGLSGSFFAARREVCADFSGEMQSDFRTVLNSLKMDLRGVSEPAAIGFYPDLGEHQREFDRKARTVLRGLTVFFRHLEFLNVFRYGFFSYQFFCHKLLRWLVPLFLLAALAAHLHLAVASSFWLVLLIVHLVFYLAAIWGWRRRTPPHPVFRIPAYFLSANVAILVAWWRYLRGERMVMWTPSQR